MTSAEQFPPDPESWPEREPEPKLEEVSEIILPDDTLTSIAIDYGSPSIVEVVSSYVSGGMSNLAQLALATNKSTAEVFKKIYKETVRQKAESVQKAGGAIIDAAGILDPRRLFNKD